jgi:hypothetical protein
MGIVRPFDPYKIYASSKEKAIGLFDSFKGIIDALFIGSIWK